MFVRLPNCLLITSGTMNQLCFGFSFFRTAGGSSLSDSDSVSCTIVELEVSLIMSRSRISDRSSMSLSCLDVLTTDASSCSRGGCCSSSPLQIHLYFVKFD